MKTTLLISFLISTFSLFSQTVSVGLIYNSGLIDQSDIADVYEENYGAGNVTVNDYGSTYNTPLTTLQTNDVILVNIWNDAVTNDLLNNLTALFNQGKHLVISTEGSALNGDDDFLFASNLWNNITGQAITETKAWLDGTATPPRLHPSSGPGSLSEHATLDGSTTSYSSYGNLNPLNVIHQREVDLPDCNNIQGLDALHPYEPVMGTGTLYITGEIQYPFSNSSDASEVDDLLANLATLHHVLLTGDNASLNLINSWLDDPAKRVALDIPVVDLGPDVFLKIGETVIFDASNAGSNYLWNTGEITQTIEVGDEGKYKVVVTSPSGCVAEDSVFVEVEKEIFIYVPNTFTPDNDGLNDLFIPSIEGLEENDEFEFFIFDRWGNKVYHTNSLNVKWNGGDTKVSGTYVWRLRYKTSQDRGWKNMQGHFNALK